jgi:hypothetical protein
MLLPLPRRSHWRYHIAHPSSDISLPRKGSRVGLRIDLFEACSAFTRVTACTLALSPIRDSLSEGFSHFVTSMTAPVASGWSICRVGFAPTGKRRLISAHTRSGHRALRQADVQPTRVNGAPLNQRCKPVKMTHEGAVSQILSFDDSCHIISPYAIIQMLGYCTGSSGGCFHLPSSAASSGQ